MEDIEVVVEKFADLEVFNKKDKLSVDRNQTWAWLKNISEDEFTAECGRAEERRIRRGEEGIYTSSDEEEYEEYEGEGEESVEELDGEEEEEDN